MSKNKGSKTEEPTRKQKVLKVAGIAGACIVGLVIWAAILAPPVDEGATQEELDEMSRQQEETREREGEQQGDEDTTPPAGDAGSTTPPPANNQQPSGNNNQNVTPPAGSGPSGSGSSSAGSATTGYKAIYDTYAARLRAECPSLSVTECAVIANEGVTKMAEYMWRASGTDGQMTTYEHWAGRLMEVYMQSAR